MFFKNTKLHATFLLWSSIIILLSSVCTNSSIPGHNPSSNYTAEKEELVQLFDKWMKAHGKTYALPEEKSRRYQNFVKNFDYVHEWNANKEEGSHVLELNNFADLSIEELKGIYMRNNHREKRKVPRNKMNMQLEQESSCNPPPSLDWRHQGVVSRVKDQGYVCGSCWAFAATGAIESINAIVTGRLISLSEQELIECSGNWGCKGGYMETAFDWVVKNGGINSELNYPYTQNDGKCNITKAKHRKVRIDGYKRVAPNHDALLCAVTKQPIAVSITTNSPNLFFYAKGIYDGNCSNNPDDMNHQILLVGYGSQNGTDYWILKNSWNVDWGDQGYFYMKRDRSLPLGKCTIYAEAAFPTLTHDPHYPTRNHASSFLISDMWAIFLVASVVISNLLFM